MGDRLQVHLPPLLPWQQEIWDCRERFIVIGCPRQIGKTTFGIVRATAEAANGGSVWWIAPSFDLATEFKNRFEKFIAPIPNIRSNKDERIYQFPGGGYVRIMSGYEPERLVGGTLTLAIFDEAAILPEVTWSKVSPALMVKKGRALLLSTPGRKNWFWRAYEWGDPTSTQYIPGWKSFSFPQTVNPAITQEDIERARLEMTPNQFRREVLGQFVDDGGIVFELIREQASVLEGMPPQPGHDYYGGIDWGAAQDWTAISIFDKTDMQQVALYRWTQMLWQEQMDMVRQYAEFWNIRHFDVEVNAAGSVTYELLSASGVPVRMFSTQENTKRELIDIYARAIGTKRIKLLKHSQLIAEHEAYEASIMPSGRVRYNAPRGFHDDTVIASALSYRAATWSETSDRISALNIPHTIWGEGYKSRDWAFSSNRSRRMKRRVVAR